MKTQAEIVLKAKEYAESIGSKDDRTVMYDYARGYTQCQEDMADKKYTEEDMKKACACGIDIVCKEGPNDFQLFEDLINSINKQD